MIVFDFFALKGEFDNFYFTVIAIETNVPTHIALAKVNFCWSKVGRAITTYMGNNIKKVF